MAKVPRIYICVDDGMVWEAYGDIAAVLVIKNVQKQWFRHLKVVQDPQKVTEEEEILLALKEVNYKPPDLMEEERKHIKVRPLLKK